MATMIPNDVEEFHSDGERDFYKFLQLVGKPDSRYVSWYLPDVQDKEPDFILFCEDVGLIIFEVKDWILGQIREANPHSFILDIGGRMETRKNPLRQATDYLNSLKDKIRQDGQLVSREPGFHGNPRIPIHCGIVFPNINKFEYTEKGFHQVISHEKVFFWDDLHPMSDICSDRSGQCFLNSLRKMFPPIFPFKLTGRELNHLKFLMFPEVKMDLPKRDQEERYAHEMQRLKILDHHQEAIARKYDGGHRIIVGPPGSGKTLILVHKAAFLRRYNPSIKKILFVCYNITLVNYIKRLFSDKGIGLGEGGVEVYHFYQLCSKILGQEVSYENEEGDYYSLIAQETLSMLKEKDLKYNAIMVDEGQDFSDDMYKVITSLLNPKTNSLTIALDENQNLYCPSATWRDLGIQARGRTHKISHVYRNTREISECGARFIGGTGPLPVDEQERQQELFANLDGFNGPKPEMKQFRNMEEMIASMADSIKKLVDSKECPFSEVAVIYASRAPWNMLDKNLPQMIETALETKGILYKWASEDYRSKRSYDVTTNSVTISTIHSAKGLDYSCVFLVGLDFIAPDKVGLSQIQNLVYVGITRARYRLFIPYVNKNDLINRLLGCLEDNNRSRG